MPAVAEVKMVTPEQAAKWLENNMPRNRSVLSGTVDAYAAQMRAGKWRVNGETIKLSLDGYLIDGQHRLHACVKAGIAVPMMVVSGVDKSVYVTIDVGRKKSVANMLTLEGVSNSTVVAASVPWVYAIKERSPVRKKLEAEEVLRFVQGNPTIIDSAAVATTCSDVGPASVFCALHHVFCLADAPKAEEFFRLLHSGAGMDEGHPVLRLRNRFIRDRAAREKRREPTALGEVAAQTINAWNAFRSSRVVVRTPGVRLTEGQYRLPAIA